MPVCLFSFVCIFRFFILFLKFIVLKRLINKYSRFLDNKYGIQSHHFMSLTNLKDSNFKNLLYWEADRNWYHSYFLSVSHSLYLYPQFSSVTQSCLTLCNPINRSTPGLPVHHQLPGFTQTYVHWVGDVIQPSHPLSSPSPPAPNPSQHQSLFQWVNSSHEVAKVLEFQL